MFSASGKTREVNETMLDDELKEYLDLKFNELERHIEMVFDHKKDVSIKKILPVSRGIISSDVLEKYIKKLFPIVGIDKYRSN